MATSDSIDQEVTINDLSGTLLFGPSVDAFDAEGMDIYNEVLAGRLTADETAVTNFMAIFSGPLEEAVIWFFCSKVDRDYDPDMRLLSGQAFAKATGQRDRRKFDLVIAIRQVPGDDSSWEPVIIVEAKFNAAVNTSSCHCAPGAYRNQIICYPQCVHPKVKINIDDPAEERTVSFIWLCKPHRHGPGFGPWGMSAVHEKWALTKGQDELDALVIQNKYVQLWKPAYWSELGQSLLDDPARTGIGEHPALPSILRFIRAT